VAVIRFASAALREHGFLEKGHRDPIRKISYFGSVSFKKKIQQIVFVIVDELKIIIDSLSEILSIINCFNCGGTRVNLSGDIVEKH
jgi:hypothetical protein